MELKTNKGLVVGLIPDPDKLLGKGKTPSPEEAPQKETGNVKRAGRPPKGEK